MVTIILKADIPDTDLQGLKEAAAMANPALEPGQEINEADGEPIFHADEEEGADHEQ